MKYFLVYLSLSISFLACKPSNKKSLVVTANPIDAYVKGDILVGASVLNDPDRFVWGASVIKDGNKYHMLYSTWPCGDSLPTFGNSWVLHSKIAYATSNYPDRDFKFQKVILEGRKLSGDSLAWDAQMVHNPHIKKFNNKFYLYYVSAKDPGKPSDGASGFKLNKRNRVQQNQKIGVIEFETFDDLVSGNFSRPEKPILSPRTRVKPDNIINPSPKGTVAKPDNIIVVNPSVVQRPSDGKFLLYFKGNIYIPHWRGAHGVAISDNPNGPFKTIDDYVFDIKMEDGTIASAEDPFVWYHKLHEQFYVVFKDFSGKITEGKPGLAILTSEDGISWNKPQNPFFMKKELILKNGDTIKVNRLERPQLLIDDSGNPITLYCASSLFNVNPRKDGSSFNVQIPLKVMDIKN